MAAPVYVTFRHMTPRAGLEEYAREQAARLERFYARLVDCRVLLEPKDTGVLRAVVELTVPGERLVASHQSNPDAVAVTEAGPPPVPEHQWLHVLHEAFATAGGILQEYAGRRFARARRRPRLVR